MERRTYIWELSGDRETETFAIIAHSGRYNVPRQKPQYLPVKMQVKICQRDGQNIDLTELIHPCDEICPCTNAEFLGNRTKILRGECHNWFLAGFEPVMTGVLLWYYNEELGDVEKIYLHAYSWVEKYGELYIEFHVPHANGKPDTEYLFGVECRRPGDPTSNFVLLEAFSQNTQKCISFCCDKCADDLSGHSRNEIIYPKYADVTEYTDI